MNWSQLPQEYKDLANSEPKAYIQASDEILYRFVIAFLPKGVDFWVKCWEAKTISELPIIAHDVPNESVKVFHNGFQCWAETHHIVVQEISLREGSGGLVDKQDGMGNVWQLGIDLTDEFEEKNKGVEWGMDDRDYWDEIMEFLNSKNL
jgi:hypothetical protein